MWGLSLDLYSPVASQHLRRPIRDRLGRYLIKKERMMRMVNIVPASIAILLRSA